MVEMIDHRQKELLAPKAPIWVTLMVEMTGHRRKEDGLSRGKIQDIDHEERKRGFKKKMMSKL